MINRHGLSLCLLISKNYLINQYDTIKYEYI